MIRVLRDFRLLPVVLLATVSLLALKSLGLIFDGWYILGPPIPEQTETVAAADRQDAGDIVGSISQAKPEPTLPEEPAVTAPVIPAAPEPRPASRQSWAQEMFNFPDITGSVGGGEKKEKPPASAPPGPTKLRNESSAQPELRMPPTPSIPTKPENMPDRRSVSPAERAILERLQDRRKDLEAQARKLEMREVLLKAAEKRLEDRMAELKQVQASIEVANEKKEEVTSERFKNLVSMYENMKAKDAARIFDRLDMKILLDVAGRINPRRMADILANMSPEAAERLTVEFANRGGAPRTPSPADLPKIEGRPTPNP